MFQELEVVAKMSGSQKEWMHFGVMFVSLFDGCT